MPVRQSVHFILTGGTIDSHYDGSKDTAVPNRTSAIPEYIKSLKLYDNVQFTEVCMKDSRDLTNVDLAKILHTVQRSKSDKIIILHGTYTMPDTARFLEARLKGNKKRIILTGAMIPLIGFSPSDSPFNLGYALAMVKTSAIGIYVAMNGRLFRPNEVVKVLRQGRFASVFGEKGLRR